MTESTATPNTTKEGDRTASVPVDWLASASAVAPMPEQDQLEAVAFVGDTLAPFFLQDPHTGTAGDLFAAIGALDAQGAGAAWPFVDFDRAAGDLVQMQAGLADGLSDQSDLTWEYRRLFVGPGKMPCPPWGSVYTDHECVIFGESNLALREWMRAYGIERQAEESTPEDHIGLMLSLMAWIATNEPTALDEYLRLHLLTWAHHYLDELAEAAEHPFYQGLADLTKASLTGIRLARGLQVKEPRFYR